MEKYDHTKFLHSDEIKLSSETLELLKEASSVYKANFDCKVWYGRCIFISWYCGRGSCKFCFRSTQKHKIMHPEGSRRSMGSILLEALFCKVFNWRIEFLTGGYDIMPFPELLEIIKNVYKVYGEKLWLNLGVLKEEEIEAVRPYVGGICSSLETLTPKLHDEVCPDKPIKPYAEMFSKLKGLKKSICVIIGLGDKESDISYLFDFVEKYDIDRVTMYALKPVFGTGFTHGPTVEEMVRRIAKLRIRFPKLEIIGGTNLRRAEDAGWLVKAGANAITKFPATKQFGTEKAKIVERLVSEEREFISNLSCVPPIDWEKEIMGLDIEEKYKQEMLEKLDGYLHKFRNPRDIDPKLLKE